MIKLKNILSEIDQQVDDPIANKDAKAALDKVLTILNQQVKNLKPVPKDKELDESLALAAGLIAGAPGLITLLGQGVDSIANVFQKDKKKGTVVGKALKHAGHLLEESYLETIAKMLMVVFPSTYEGQDITDKHSKLYEAAHTVYAAMLVAAAVSSANGAVQAHNLIASGLEGGLSAFKASEVGALAAKFIEV